MGVLAVRELVALSCVSSRGKMAKEGNIKDFYDFGEELGRGEFSVVIKATEKATGEIWAIKCIQKETMEHGRLETEIKILQDVEHPHVIKLKEYFESAETVYLVMEMVTGGELFDKITQIGCYSEATACELVANILDAVAYLHSQNIVHRDLKPTNLLLKSEEDDTNIKIADFGLSKIISDELMMVTACGTPIYVAPEVLQGEVYDKEVDMWSIGVITYILLCGFPPFFDDGSNMAELFEQIMAGEYDYPEEYWDDISDEAKDLIDNLLLVDPEERFTAQQALQHPWLVQGRQRTAELRSVGSKMSTFLHSARNNQ